MEVSSQAPVPLWQTTLASLLIAVVVFALGYFLVYRRQLGPQLRHLQAQLLDRDAGLAAAQAARALELAKLVAAWHPNATADCERPGWSEAVSATDAAGSARLANDGELRRLLVRYGELVGVVREAPEMWLNIVLSINRSPELQERLGAVSISEVQSLTPAQSAFLAPARVSWEDERARWGQAMDELLYVATTLRDRAELLLRAAPERA